jgi:hypothetical protein
MPRTSEFKFGSLREKIAAEKTLRVERAAKFREVFQKAATAGRVAGENAIPEPMMVIEPGTNPHVPKAMWHVSEGACGFAWVNVSPGNTPFANWLKKNNLARKSFRGGVEIWISDFNQSVERKDACARAMAEVFRDELGVSAFAGSRLD